MEAEPRGHAYDDEFFSYIEEGSKRSAQVIVPLMRSLLKINSVLDVGCGRGVWLKEWGNCGVSDFFGVDGAYVDDAQLIIAHDRFAKCDLSHIFDLKRRFDLVQSLEVGEHIANESAEIFVASLAAHGDAILFSAAVPGQGGEFHVNEQPYTYWRDKFAAHGFRTFDWLRPRIRRVAAIETWYRYNTLLFARDAAISRASPELLETEIPHDQPIAMRASLFWRVRNRILAQLPQPLVHQLAIVKHKLVLKQRSFQSVASNCIASKNDSC